MIPIIIEYAAEFKILKFHSTFKSLGVELSDECATTRGTGANIYVLSDDEPVKIDIDLINKSQTIEFIQVDK